MKNANKSINAIWQPNNNLNDNDKGIGLTKREYMATIAMQGIVTGKPTLPADSVAIRAIQMADALLKELELSAKK